MTVTLKETIGVAVVGTGSIGMRHLRILGQLETANPVAVPVHSQRIAQLKEEGFSAVADLDEAIQRGVTWAIIASDTGRHLEDSFAALERRLDLLVEKPLAVDAEQATRIVAQARQSKRRLFVGCVLRFSESLNRFRELLGQIGPLHSVRIECQSYLPDWRPNRPYRESYSARMPEGGVLRDLIHELDYAGWLFGWPSAVQGKARNLGRLGIQSEEVADLLWETPEGCVISVHLDYLTRPTRRRMTAAGALGTLEWDGVGQTVTLSLSGTPPQEFRSLQTRDELFLAQAQAFLNTSQASSDPRLATGEDGVQALAVCDAVRIAKSGWQPVKASR